MTVKNVDVVLVSFNSASVLPQAIASLPNHVRAIIVDNNSSDNSITVAEAAGAQVVALPQNRGFGSACNAGAKQGKADHILFLNPDARLDKGSLELLSGELSQTNVGMVGPMILNEDNQVTIKRRSILCSETINGEPKKPIAVKTLSGAALLVRRELFEKLGGFDENLFLYFEDDDLCKRIDLAGFDIRLVPDAIVRHAGGQSSGPSLVAERIKQRENLKSEFYVRRKYGLANTLKYTRRTAFWKHALYRLIGNKRKANRYAGVLEGFAGLEQMKITNTK